VRSNRSTLAPTRKSAHRGYNPRVQLFLTSLSIAALPDFLGGRGRLAAWVPTAADALSDGAEVRALFAAMLEATGVKLAPCELDQDDDPRVPLRLGACDLVVVTGGDPFHLLARARASGFDRAVRDAVAGGLPYVGVSAGAIVAGPSLEPHVLASPFVPPRGLALEGLALTDRVVLPHHGRADLDPLHDAARHRYGQRFALEPLRDDEALVVEGGAVRRLRV
jgi:dipeptidase E